MTHSILPTKDAVDSVILADAHVHIYDCFKLDKFLDYALDNFQKFSANFSVLLLTEISNDHYFKTLLEYAKQQKKIQGWTFHETLESESVYAQNCQNQGIFLVAGRQIVTSENLEVLALMTNQTFEDDLPLQKTIQTVLKAGGLPILPWGFGKWLGRRGKLLKNLLNSDEIPKLFLGDNGGRPVFWLRPKYFQLAETKGWKVLPGTDPLPLVWESTRPGSFGFKIQGKFNGQKPAESLKEILRNSDSVIQPYGSLQNPWNFVCNQVAILSKKLASF